MHPLVQDTPKETLHNKVVHQSTRGLGHIITEEGCQTSKVMTPSRGALARALPVTFRDREYR